MRTIRRLLYLTVLFLFVSTLTYATEHYVDLNASGQNNGTSWANAWENVNQINWSLLGAGDTLFISGGAAGDSVTYYQEMTVGASGEPGNPLVITPGNDAGHNGTVIFDGQNAGRNCIEFLSSDYVTLNGQNRLKIYRGGYGSSGMIRVGNVNDVIIEYCYFNQVYGNGAIRLDGGNYTRTPPHNIIIRYNDIHMGAASPSGTRADNIVVNNINGLWIDHNKIIGDNVFGNCDGGLHCDNIQVYRHSGNLIISNNYMYDYDGSPGVPGGCHQMLMMENVDGVNVLYNNVFYMPNKDGGNTILDKSNPYPQKQWHLIHNTMVTGTNSNQANMHANTFSGYNNLWHATHNQSGNHGIDPGSGFDYTKVQGNLFGDNYSSIWEDNSLSYVQSLGGETFGTATNRTYVDPMLTNGQDLPDVYPNDDFHLLPGSPAIGGGIYDLGGGETLQALVESFGLEWEDMDGNPRGSSPDIGAYQYSGGNDTTFLLSVQIVNDKNLVSVPGINPEGMGVNTWWAYRDMSANVYRYSNGYETVTTTTPGVGYWMKHSGSRYYNTGDEWPTTGIQKVVHAPLNVESGWNMIGGYELSVSAANVTTNPPGLLSGPIYKYSGGYYPAATITPGFGYWVKLTGPGQIILPQIFSKGDESKEWFSENWGKIILTDATGTTYTLYAVKGEVDLSQFELPPSPMKGMFDIRFSSGRIAEHLDDTEKTIEMSGINYPIKIKIENMNITLKDEYGKNVNAFLKNGEEVIISDNTIDRLKIVSAQILNPVEYSLEQNYPNPFNPRTTIRFSLPKETQLKINIYNMLGELVKTLAEGNYKAGYHNVTFNASTLPSGAYIYRIESNAFVQVKKMLLLK